MLGCGTIGRCALPMLLEVLAIVPEQITILEADDSEAFLSSYIAAGLRYRRTHITRDNLDTVLSEVTRSGDLLLNLSVGIDSIETADWCHHHGVLYIDTALEPWEDDLWNFERPLEERTEYGLHQKARKLAAQSWDPKGPTAVITHGANPGLVSHFVKAALLDLADALGRKTETPGDLDGWARLAQSLDVKVIHIAERDTQITVQPRPPGAFFNTWSIPGFLEEAVMAAEFGWGTHETVLPDGAVKPEQGPRNAIFLPQPAARVLLRSWVPLGGPIAGLALPHSELITISDALTVWEAGRAIYRPTVAFAYLACDAAMASLHDSMMAGWRLPEEQQVMNGDITEGRDELGVLLMGHGLTGWWYGSQLDIHEARRLVPGNNPTAIQVAAGVVAAAAWARRHPSRGFNEPEALPHAEILATARPYLGPMVSQPTDWTPLKGRGSPFPEPELDLSDPWQFTNFLVR